MTDIVHEFLKKMAVGTSIILAGTIVSMLFEFLSRILNIAVIIASPWSSGRCHPPDRILPGAQNL